MSRENMKGLEQKLKDKGLLDEPLVVKLLDNYKDKAKTKYGLVWEDHPEQVHEELKSGISNVTEYKDKRINMNSDMPENLLIEGDNLHGLMLMKEEGVKVDVIYIDPPYNTGNEFIYNDKIVDSEDGYRHSKWLSFMSKRLELAYDLLEEDGVIFVSIDYREVSNLQLLMVQIFGERNLINMVSVQTANNVYGSKASSAQNTIVKTGEFLIAYSKNKNETKPLNPLKTQKKYLIDSHYSTYIGDNLERERVLDVLSKDKKISEAVAGNINFRKLNAVFSRDIQLYNYFLSKYSNNIYMDSAYGAQLTNEEELEVSAGNILLKGEHLVFRTLDGNGTVRHYTPLSKSISKSDDYESILCDTAIRGSVWDYADDMANIGREGGVRFENGKKPVRLIKDILKLSNISNATVLDFFAGSGTTAQAVMELNEEDGGNRQFILMTNNEVSTDTVFNLAKEDEDVVKLLKDNNISLKAHKGAGSVAKNEQRKIDIEKFFESGDGKDFFNSNTVQDEGICRKVTYERIRRVIEGDYVNKKDVSPLPNNLSYFKLDVEQDYDFRDEYMYRMRQSLLGLIIKEGVAPTKINNHTYVFDRGNKEAMVYDAGLYTEQNIVDQIKETFIDYTFDVISEHNNADIKWKKLREGED